MVRREGIAFGRKKEEAEGCKVVDMVLSLIGWIDRRPASILYTKELVNLKLTMTKFIYDKSTLKHESMRFVSSK